MVLAPSNILGMKLGTWMIALKLFNIEQKQRRMNIIQMLTTFNDYIHLLKKVITGPSDFFLFPNLKPPMKGKHFVTIEEIKVRKIDVEAVGDTKRRVS